MEGSRFGVGSGRVGSGLAFGGEAIADPGFALDIARVSGTFDFFAELGDEDAKVLRLVDAAGSPDGAEQGFVGEDAAGILREDDQEIELLGGEVDLIAAERDGVRLPVDVEVSFGDVLDGGLLAGELAQLRADAGEELLDAEGFGDVVVGTGVERSDLDVVLFADGEDDDGCFGEEADGARELKTVHLRHGEVGDDEIGCGFGEAVEGFDAVGGKDDLVSAALERGAQDAGDLRLVIDYKDAHA